MATREDGRRSDTVGARRVGRGTARLLVAAPAMIGSFLLLLVVMGWAGPWEPLLLLAWLASAAAVFTPIGERVVVRWACGFVWPSPRQRAQLDPVWRQVLARCDVDPREVDLYLQRSRAVNAFTAGGRSVALTTGAQAEFVKPRLSRPPAGCSAAKQPLPKLVAGLPESRLSHSSRVRSSRPLPEKPCPDAVPDFLIGERSEVPRLANRPRNRGKAVSSRLPASPRARRRALTGTSHEFAR